MIFPPFMLEAFLNHKEEKQPPVIVNVDLSALAALFEHGEIKTREARGTTIMPS